MLPALTLCLHCSLVIQCLFLCSQDKKEVLCSKTCFVMMQVRSRAVKRAAKLVKQDGSSKPRLKVAFDCFASDAR